MADMLWFYTIYIIYCDGYKLIYVGGKCACLYTILLPDLYI